MSEREQYLDNIRQHSDKLNEIAKRYAMLLYMAEQDDTDTFILLSEAAGNLTVENLKATGDLLNILWRVASKKETESGE